MSLQGSVFLARSDSEVYESRLFAAIDHEVNFRMATGLWWASEPDIP